MSKNKSLIFLSVALTLIIFTILKLDSRQEDRTVSLDQALLAPNLYNTSWLTVSTCEQGCWEGLMPQQTSQEEAVATIRNLQFVNKDNLSINESSLAFFCNPPLDKTVCGMLIFEGTLLQKIILFPNYLITLDQAIEKLGAPDGYSCVPTDPGATGYELLIYYTKKQVFFVYSEWREDLLWRKSVCAQITVDGKLPIGYPVEEVYFTYPYTLDEMTDAQPWVGFSEEKTR